jgi:glycine betaine/proline transport system ATP-binding protein
MKDGAIDQLGTANEIITNPATDYVAEFTKEVSREKLLTVANVMREGAVDAAEERVSADEHLSDVAAELLRAEGLVNVVDAEGRPVGVVSRDDVIDALFERRE